MRCGGGRVVEAAEQGELPPRTAVSVDFGVEERGFFNDFESEGRGGGGVGDAVVDEEDGPRGAFSEDFDGAEVVYV